MGQNSCVPQWLITRISDHSSYSYPCIKQHNLEMGDRKARLAALAAKAGRAKKADEETGDENDQVEVIDQGKPQSVTFRNYAPNDEGLERNDQIDEKEGESPLKRPRVEDGKAASSSSVLQEALLEAKQELAISNTKGKGINVEEISAAPKKINWDLKRDIQDKLNKLEKRTQKVIVEMLKERLEKEAAEQAESGESDLD